MGGDNREEDRMVRAMVMTIRIPGSYDSTRIHPSWAAGLGLNFRFHFNVNFNRPCDKGSQIRWR